MNYWLVGIVLAVMVALRFVKLNVLAWMAVWLIGCYVVLKWGISPPIPSSIVAMCMAIVAVGLVAYATSSTDKYQVAVSGILNFLSLKKYTGALIIVALLIPMLLGVKYFFDQSKEAQPPVFGRTVHPAPPATINFKGKTIDLIDGHNPYRELETTNPEEYKTHIANGRKVYYQNCVFCHGDNMEGKGIFAHGYNPKPTNFADPTTIAMLTETFLFWRIAKGAPGLPEESGPWESAMPAWELFLSEDDIWDVTMFLYEFTNQKPRVKGHAK